MQKPTGWSIHKSLTNSRPHPLHEHVPRQGASKPRSFQILEVMTSLEIVGWLTGFACDYVSEAVSLTYLPGSNLTLEVSIPSYTTHPSASFPRESNSRDSSDSSLSKKPKPKCCGRSPNSKKSQACFTDQYLPRYGKLPMSHDFTKGEIALTNLQISYLLKLWNQLSSLARLTLDRQFYWLINRPWPVQTGGKTFKLGNHTFRWDVFIQHTGLLRSFVSSSKKCLIPHVSSQHHYLMVMD